MKGRTFFWLWVAFTTSVLFYAGGDLAMNPGLVYETSMTFRPDLSRIDELVHWGGRLVNNGLWGLLIANAIVLGGFMALVVSFIIGRFQKARKVERYIGDDEPSTLRTPYSR